MIKFTIDETQCIRDEETLMQFFREKLKLSISKALTLDDITLKFSNHALGINGFIASFVKDCQEISLIPGHPSGIVLIRCKREPRSCPIQPRTVCRPSPLDVSVILGARQHCDDFEAKVGSEN